MRFDQRGDARRDFVGRGLERRRGFAQLGVAGDEPLARAFAGQRLDAADARGDRAFGDDLEDGDVAERVDVGAAAQFDAE